MKIGILGSGPVAKTLGLGFIRSGHQVKLGTRDINKLNEWLSEAGPNASVGSFSEASSFGEIIVLATLFSGTENAIKISGLENFTNKVVVDTTNPLDFSSGVPPKFTVIPGNSAGEQIQRWLPDSKVVKAFNSVSASIMINPKLQEGNPDLLIAGDDLNAKKEVITLAGELGWQNIIDIGDIKHSFWLEAFAMLWIEFGFKYNHWTHAFKLLYK